VTANALPGPPQRHVVDISAAAACEASLRR